MMVVNYVVSIFLIVLGLYTVATKTNLIKIILGLSIIDYGINLFIVSIGFNAGMMDGSFTWADIISGPYFIDPVPSALTLTSIVIGACVDAMALSLVVAINKKYGTVDAREIRRLNG